MNVSFVIYLYPAPGLPENLRRQGATPTAIVIEWDPVPCLQQNSLITSYIIEVRPRGGGEPITTGEVAADGSLMFRASNLATNTSFLFRVYPVTSEFGRSEEFSSLITFPGS